MVSHLRRKYIPYSDMGPSVKSTSVMTLNAGCCFCARRPGASKCNSLLAGNRTSALKLAAAESLHFRPNRTLIYNPYTTPRPLFTMLGHGAYVCAIQIETPNQFRNHAAKMCPGLGIMSSASSIVFLGSYWLMLFQTSSFIETLKNIYIYVYTHIHFQTWKKYN